LDRLLVRILKERVEIGKELARIKKDRGVGVENPAQEEAVIERIRSYAEDQISEDCGEEVKEVWRAIIELTKSEMRRYEETNSSNQT